MKIKNYNPSQIEKKWQKIWEQKKFYKAGKGGKKKFYALIEFPYPSGDGLHVGHIRSNTAMDIIARKRRREGFDVLYPIGWDAFGLPTENYAIKTGKEPALITKKNCDTFRRQLKSLGFSFDWDREINTTDPEYYKWTQWIFLQFFKKGLAYKKKMTVNWCPKDLTGLANEEVIDGKCERCGTTVEKRDKEQWMLAITKYADRLEKDLDTVDFLEKIKIQQRNWIGRSEGAEIEFKIKNKELGIKVFTTRPDTLFGVTYIVLAPESPLVTELLKSATNKEKVLKYIENSKNKTEIERLSIEKEKTGVEIDGVMAINPVNNEEIPIWVADYVLAEYGTGAVMAVPAHDERDFVFATKYKLPIKEVVIPERIDKRNPPVPGKQKVERQNVHVIVRNPKDDKILCLSWIKHPWKTFPMGGVEQGESLIEAARREVLEETGYKNLINGKVLGGQVRAEYFAAHKDQNRVSFTNLVTFDLENEEKADIATEEKEAHEIFWAPLKELTTEFMTHAEMDIWLERLNGKDKAYVKDGVLINSSKFNGLNSDEVMKEITEYAHGKWITTFKLRDWVFSRQRYWGEPIPIIHCEKCGAVPVPEKDLPVKLPRVKKYKPTETGESPLAHIDKWVNTKCPKCKGCAKRETDTMPNWAGSSWYYLRYIDPKNKKSFADKKALKNWLPVDWYNGGMEHVTLHLLYSRFWHKFLYDLKLVPTSEPYKKRTAHGMILAPDGEKMSKSRGNVINPDGLVKQFGADTIRIYEMFMGPFDQSIAWNTDSMVGVRRFLEKIWRISLKVINKKQKIETNKELISLEHRTIKKVGEDIENMRFNTAISTMMIFSNELDRLDIVQEETYLNLIKILAPFAPHITEEIWSMFRNGSVHKEKWPIYKEEAIKDNVFNIVIQVNGKVRAIINMDSEKARNKEEMEKIARSHEKVQSWILDKKLVKTIIVPEKLVNFVVS